MLRAFSIHVSTLRTPVGHLLAVRMVDEIRRFHNYSGRTSLSRGVVGEMAIFQQLPSIWREVNVADAHNLEVEFAVLTQKCAVENCTDLRITWWYRPLASQL